MKKKIALVTGGAGFVGSNLINLFLKKTKKKIISLDNYSSGTVKNHVDNKRVIYIRGNTIEIEKKLSKFKKKIHSIFHFGEFARIYQSFKKFDECYKSNSIGSNAVFKFCLENKIKQLQKSLDVSKSRLENENFMKNAKQELIDLEKNNLDSFSEEISNLEIALNSLKR